jgi:hypothetical protein
MYVTITVSTTGTTPASISTVDITEVRVIRGDQTNLFAEYTTPGTYAPTRVRQVNGVLNIEPNGGTGNVTLGGDLTVSGNDINLGTGFTVSGVGVSAVQFTRNDSGARANITTARVFPGDQTTRYIDDNGSAITTSAALSVGTTLAVTGNTTTTGSIQNNNGNYFSDQPATTFGTGQIANEAMWFLSSGTNYALRRSTGTSWAKFKKNIEPTSISPEQFTQLTFVDFNWDEDAMEEQFPNLAYIADEKQHGLLLDQVEQILPEAVQQPSAPTDTETIAWHIVYLSAMVALQDAIKRIEVLEAKVAALESR